MIGRNVESRIVKLEANRRRPEEIMVIWRRHGEDAKAATARVQFSPSDRVICAEWLSDGEPPAPRWYSDRLSKVLPPDQLDCIERALHRIASESLQEGPVRADAVSNHRMIEMSDNDLLHLVLGVPT